MNSAFEWANIGLFIVASVVAFGSLNKMRAGHTRPCIIGAVLLIAVGCAAQALGSFASQWDHIADTLVAGGVLALLIASQRTHSWALERWANPIASVIGVVIGGVFLAWLLSGCTTVPKPVCEPPEIDVVRTQQGTFYVLDEVEVRKLAAQLKGLEAGTCRLYDPHT
jgi:hypothetical protein